MINKKGFTLIEVLIVVAIIGILASVVLIGLGPLQRQGRDARRISDMKQVQAGLELYFTKNGAYPVSTDWLAFWSTLVSTLKGDDIGISNVPSDPNDPAKTYHYLSNGNQYVLGADLDDTNNAALKGDVDAGTIPNDPDGLDDNCGAAADDAVYCVTL